MLSMAAVGSSAVAASYFERDDYYVGDGDCETFGEWFGDGANRLGLDGTVDKDNFKALLDGHLPTGEQLGIVREKGGAIEHRPGWDLTFSAPKSVSLLAEVGADARVMAAHDRAVKAALSWIEASVAGTRIRSGGVVERVQTGNLVAATFRHHTSRNHDPQLHTHAVVMNATQSGDGRWRSLDDKKLFENKMAAGAVYRAELAVEMRKLGFEIEQTHADGRWEVAGVSVEALREFSTRRQEIEASLTARGQSGAEASAQAALMTRHSKVPENRAELANEWRARAEAINFDPQQLIRAASQRQTLHQVAIAGGDSRALHAAINRLAEQEAVFKHSALLAWTLAGGVGHLTVGQAEALIERERAAGRLHSAKLGDQASWTTISALQQELRIQTAVDTGKDTVTPAYTGVDAVTALAASPLNAGQREAVEMILTTHDRHVGVVGRPGSGKTFMLGHARALMAERDFRLVGMAASADAARQLQQSAGIASRTLRAQLSEVAKDAARLHSNNPAVRLEIETRYRKQVWVVDEASQVNSATMRRLLDLATKLGARTIQVGDTAQLGAIEAGKPFAQMIANGMQTVEMDEIRRQADARHVEAIRDVIGADIGVAIRKLAPETREIADREDRLSAMLKNWTAAGDARDRTLMLAVKNVTRTELNDRARNILRVEGRLANEKPAQQLIAVYAARADTALASSYKPGHVVHFPRALASLGIARCAYARVIGVDPQTGTVQLDVDGRAVDWQPGVIAGGSKMPPQIYAPRQTSLAPGERIVWSKNNADLGLTNGQRLTVISNGELSMTAQTEDGRRVEIDQMVQRNQHWEHGYATTVYKAQGQTAEHVLVEASSADKTLLSQKAFLVAISRQRDSLTIYTDSVSKLASTVQRETGDKTSALDARIAAPAPDQRARFEQRYQQLSEARQVEPRGVLRRIRDVDRGWER